MNQAEPVVTTPGADAFLDQCLCLDLETHPEGRILRTGAVLGRRTLQARGGIERIAQELERLAGQASFLLGHNIIGHDLPVLKAAGHSEALFRLPVIDTLYLSPLAFPQNPYHSLVKDYKLVRASINDPVADARLAGRVFADQWGAFLNLNAAAPEVASFFRHAFEAGKLSSDTGAMFECLGVRRIDTRRAGEIFEREAARHACRTGVLAAAASLQENPALAPPLAYVLAWLRVAGSNSVLPPWVRRQFPAVVEILNRLRNLPCSTEDCAYCHETHDPRTQLKRFFGFDAYRQEPQTADGKSLQEAIVSHGMRDEPLLAIMATGGGKSLGFQIPALVRNFRRGVLTVVISPLQALMKDQVDNLTRLTGTPFAGAIYGMLTPPERGAMLESIRLGDLAILYLSPEQLRNRSVSEVLSQREIGAWVFDEAHCFSKWGHDFRPDYHYASRFIREFAAAQKLPIPPVACFTATAKADVREEILDHFRHELGQELTVFDGGAERNNLVFEIQTVTTSQKWERAHEILGDRLPGASSGSAVIYAATQKKVEEAAAFLKAKNWRVEAYHAGIEAPEKRRIQESFIAGETQIICATNAFGMGIDKDDVRLVIHLDIPGSLENYLQEAGRAGRDRRDAECILLFDEHDVETQFKLGALSRLTRKDIAQILRGLRAAKRNSDGEIVVTTGELLRSDSVELEFHHGDRGADTKIRTAIAVLEKTGFIERNQNQTRVFQGSPLVSHLEEGRERIGQLGLSRYKQKQWLAVLEFLMNAKANDGISADALAELPEFSFRPMPSPEAPNEDRSDTLYILQTLNEMADAGLIQKDLLMTAFVRHKVVNPSWQILERVSALERAVIDLLRMEEPDPEGWLLLSVTRLNQRLLDAGHASVPGTLLKLLKSIARDGRGMAGRQGSLELRYHSRGEYRAKIQRSWDDLAAISRKRHDIARLVLDLLVSKIPADAPARADFLVEFSERDLHKALDEDWVLTQGIRNRAAAFEHALMFLHDQNVIVLQQGLAVFRQAMTIRMLPAAHDRRFTRGDFSQLDQHYRERVFQVHVMHEYARLGLEKIQRALAFVASYFTLGKEEFLQRYFAGRKEVLKRATGAESYRRIVESLHHPVQMAIVAARPDANLLVLAGPGSGKTRVVAHRCAYLLRVERALARSILVLCFNRNAAITLRRRIADLAGPDARGVTIQTYHSLAMRLVGVSPAECLEGSQGRTIDFGAVIKKAIALLSGALSIPGAEPDELRETLLGGYRHILVDEYQDIDADQYELVSAIAGRTLADPDRKLSILAVGDDDQNIYGFRGANVEFIRRFEEDYRAKSHYLVENYRSTRAIIDAANRLIALNRDRMKTDHPIEPDKARSRDADGGRWQALDPVGRGRVQLLQVKNAHEQATALPAELDRMRDLSPDFQWSDCAVLGRTREELMPVRAALEACGIPVNPGLDRDRFPPLQRLREVARWLEHLKSRRHELQKGSNLLVALEAMIPEENRWWQLVRDLMNEWLEASDDAEVPVSAVVEFLYESLSQQQREAVPGNGIFLSTIHAAKGLEFRHVMLLGGGWRPSADARTQEEERRLCYVAMTRARETLALFEREDSYRPFGETLGEGSLVRRPLLFKELSPETTAVRHDLLSLEEIYLDFAGRQPASRSIHQRLADLKPGTPLTLTLTGAGHLEFLDPTGGAVARLSAKARETWLPRLRTIVGIKVVAVLQRSLKDVAAEYADGYPCETWEVPVMEIQWR